MTFRLGLADRLRGARLGWLLAADVPELAEVAAAGFAAGVDLLVLDQGTVSDAELEPVHARIRDAAPVRGLVGVQGSLTDGVDVALVPPRRVRVTRRRLHRWALVGSLGPSEEADLLWGAAGDQPSFATGSSESFLAAADGGMRRYALTEPLVDLDEALADLRAMAQRLRSP